MLGAAIARHAPPKQWSGAPNTMTRAVRRRLHMTVADQLHALGLTLPDAARPLASYVPAVHTGNLVYTSGQLPTVSGVLTASGLVGLDLNEDQGYAAARTATLNALAAISTVVALDDVTRVVHVTGCVASADGF